MWSRLTKVFLAGHVQHHRVRGAALAILLIRLVSGAIAWGILWGFFHAAITPLWMLHVTFAIYFLANLGLFLVHRRKALTHTLVWLDIAVNLLPIGLGAHWSDGPYSPLLPVFVIKIISYGLIFGADIGVQSLAAAGGIGVVLALAEAGGWTPSAAVPENLREQLTRAVGAFVFAVGGGGALRFFYILQDREMRLADAVREKDRLYRESLEHEHQLQRLSRRMMEVGERTMRRVARELHDDFGQALTAAKLELGLLDQGLPATSPARSHVHRVREQIAAILQSMRDLSQLLRPAVLDDLGLAAAIRSFATRFGRRTDIDVHLELPPTDIRLPPPIEVALYRASQEALTNVARHARARHVSIRLSIESAVATLEIRDDGRGFDVDAFLHQPRHDHRMGVLGMQERVATYGGRFTIESTPGTGTRVELLIPLAALPEQPEEDYDEDPRLVG